MPGQKILMQWIGHSDLRGLAASLTGEQQQQVLKVTGGVADSQSAGPTATLLEQKEFDAVYLLSNYDDQINQWLIEWLPCPTTVIPARLDNPTDYKAIFEIADTQLETLKKDPELSGHQLCLHLSPGTPAMTSVWLLLGKTRYPATFYESSRDGAAWVSDVPFQLIDIIPEILKDPDKHLSHLATEAPSEVEGFENIIGESPVIKEAVGIAKRAAMRSVTTLLLGESGTGKEMFAQAMHRAGPRRDKPFKPINCAAIQAELLNSELFGHKKGAFTGADQNRAGAFEQADGGTLFLDEVGECSLDTQAKLLRVLQPIDAQGATVRSINRLGDDQEKQVDVRIVAATNQDLLAMVAEGTFREDLYHRLAVLTITLPPLRDRGDDLPKIAQAMLAKINQEYANDAGYVAKHLSNEALAFIKSYGWPGNVRQLYNALLQASVMTDGDAVSAVALSTGLPDTNLRRSSHSVDDLPLGDGFSVDQYVDDIQISLIERAWKEANQNKSKTAKLLGLASYQALDGRVKSLGIELKKETGTSE